MEIKETQSITILFMEDENGKMMAYIKDMNLRLRVLDMPALNNAVQKVADVLNDIKL